VSVEFLGSYNRASAGIPGLRMPRVAFLGRSNVGKSSLINLLTNSRIARVSKTPGRTRALNLFAVDQKWVFGDFPGYGYAKVAKSEKQEWEQLVQKFLVPSAFDFAVHIVDARHPGMPADEMLRRWLLKKRIPNIIILNKADRLNQRERANADREARKAFPDQPMLFVSTVTREGKRELIKILHNVNFDGAQRAVMDGVTL
jgi:GTP-binding protein